jgi:vesicle coat complex subunit
MSYIPLPIVTEALTEPLRHALKDKDPYVRKTAAICVAKVYMADPRRTEKQGFVEMLRDLLLDTNATVVANAVAALVEISERHDGVAFKLNLTVCNKLLVALGESSECVSFTSPKKLALTRSVRWGQIYILDALMTFVPQEARDAELIAERIVVHLQHGNSAVILTTIKVLLYLMNYMTDRKLIEYVCKKMGPPLGTLHN